MKKFFFGLLDWIYKKKCYFCRQSKESVKMCSKCYDSLEFLSYGKRLAIDGVSVYVAGVYEKNLQKLIRGLKYHNQRDLAFYQAKFMYEYWQNITDNAVFEVIPVPFTKLVNQSDVSTTCNLLPKNFADFQETHSTQNL